MEKRTTTATTTTASAPRTASQRKNQGTPQLSCELCRDRKIKCNKLDPCTNCVTAGAVCVPIYRMRLPRGRHAHRAQNAAAAQQSTNTTELNDEQNALSNTVESSSDGTDEHITQQPVSSRKDSVISSASSLSFLLQNSEPIRNAMIHDEVSVKKLCQVYLRQVDPVVKILHRPSLSEWLMQGKSYLGLPSDYTPADALKSAVCYSAASSMTEHQCRSVFNVSKSTLVDGHRKACEAGLERSNLLAAQDMTALQAFVLYMVSLLTKPIPPFCRAHRSKRVADVS
jgi:hypothetical protein